MPDEGLGLGKAVQVVHEGVVGLEHILFCDAGHIHSCTGHNFALRPLLSSCSPFLNISSTPLPTDRQLDAARLA